MRALIVDVGNTRTSCVAWRRSSRLPTVAANEAGGLVAAPALTSILERATPRDRRSDPAFLASFAAAHEEAGLPPVVVVSTVPRIVELLESVVPLTVVDHRSRMPCSHRLQDLSRTGPDRLCNVAAAVAAGLRGAMVVDAGTATTVDVLRDGVYEGGVIAPGMAFAMERLGRWAARLRQVPFAPTPLAPGRDTFSAMSAGGFHAGVGGVEALVSGLLAQCGPLPVVVTGGLGGHLASADRHHDPCWTLRGAAVLAGLA